MYSINLGYIIFTQSGITPLIVAGFYNHWDLADELISRGATVSGIDNVSY